MTDGHKGRPCSRRSDTDILFSVWSLTVPCGLHSLVLPLRGSEWTLSFRYAHRLHSLRSLSLGLLIVCLSRHWVWSVCLMFYCGTKCRGGVYPHPNTRQMKLMKPDVGVGFIPILQEQNPSASPKAGRKRLPLNPWRMGINPTLHWLKSLPFPYKSRSQITLET